MRNYGFLTKKEARTADSGVLKIFISYSTKDLDKIKPILNLLSTIKGVQVFFAERSITPGSIISQSIINNIKSSDIFLVFFSESAIQSSYVQQEIGVAKASNKIIIPILLDSNKPTGMLEGINYLNFFDQTKQHFDQTKQQAEMQRLYSFIVKNIQTKNQ